MIDTKFIAEVTKQYQEAISRFGTYQFDDKGPTGVMSFAKLDSLFDALCDRSMQDAIDSLVTLCHAIPDGRGLALATIFSTRNEDNAELFYEPRIALIANGEMPPPLPNKLRSAP